MKRLLLLLMLFYTSFALAEERSVYIREIPDLQTFSLYARTVQSDEIGKFLIDVKTGEILFFDSNLYPLHLDFVRQVLYKKESMSAAEKSVYHQNYTADKPNFILGYITHHLKTDTWDYSFWENDKIRPEQIKQVYSKLNASFFVTEMPWRPDSNHQEALIKSVKGLPTITNDRIYKQVDYQSFNNGVAIGKLVVVPPETPFESLAFQATEVVILQTSYPDLPPVAGILSTTFSTPLSHVNLRARAWDVPNAGFRGAAEAYGSLNGQYVHFTVTDANHELRLATDEQVKAWKEAQAKSREVQTPKADLLVSDLKPLARMTLADVQVYGAKTANLGALMAANYAGVKVPAGFGIPFYYYEQHLKQNELHGKVEGLLADPKLLSDPLYRKKQLALLRESIQKAPLDEALLTAVYGKVGGNLGGAVFVRSSTNAEDLEGFNGAGLYDTVPNVKGKEALGEAIKKVWASLWNYHAFEERQLFAIDQRAVYPAVMIQVGVNATAAGVLVTRNLYDPLDDHSYTINAKHGLGLKVVAGTTVPEQVIYDVKYPGARVISRSDDTTMLVFDVDGGVKEVPSKAGEPVLSERNARRLSKLVESFSPLYPWGYPLDVEWLFEGDKIWIVQVRPFME